MDHIQTLIDDGYTFVINHSGGKDSQAMTLVVSERVPLAQRILIHADLGEVEWAGAVAHISDTAPDMPLHICRARRGLLQMVEERGMFPSPKYRQCTSDLKRGPIERTIRQLGIKKIVNCMGMRAEESNKRKRLRPLKPNHHNSIAGRIWYDWLPVHAMTEVEVFAKIAAAGQEPHPIYALGMRRFSCAFCIMASPGDLNTAARLATTQPELLNDPDLYKKYVGLERSTGQVMIMPTKKLGKRTLEEITGVTA